MDELMKRPAGRYVIQRRRVSGTARPDAVRVTSAIEVKYWNGRAWHKTNAQGYTHKVNALKAAARIIHRCEGWADEIRIITDTDLLRETMDALHDDAN